MGIFIGDRDFMLQNNIPQEEPEEQEHEKIDESRLALLKPINIPDKYIDYYLKDYDCVVVNDFGDEYHITEAELAKRNKYYELFKDLKKERGRSKDVTSYVRHMRACMKCLNAVAEDNGFYDPEEFKRLYFKNKLTITGLSFPKLVGPKRKVVNWDYLAEFILSDEPLENLIDSSAKVDEILSIDELEEAESILFDDIEEIIAPKSQEEQQRDSMFLDSDDEELYESSQAIPLSEKESKRMIKGIPGLLSGLRAFSKEQASVNNQARYIYNLSSDDFSDIGKYDKLHQYTSNSDMPDMIGDIMNDKDFDKYMSKLDEYDYSQVKTIYAGTFKSQEEIEEIELKQQLEELGYNIRKLYDNKATEKKLKKLEKREARREKLIKQRLVESQNRKNKRQGILGYNSEESRNGGKKKKKKGKKNSSKKKEVNRVQKEMSESVDEFLLASSDRLTGSFEDYAKDVFTFDWGNNGG